MAENFPGDVTGTTAPEPEGRNALPLRRRYLRNEVKNQGGTALTAPLAVIATGALFYLGGKQYGRK